MGHVGERLFCQVDDSWQQVGCHFSSLLRGPVQSFVSSVLDHAIVGFGQACHKLFKGEEPLQNWLTNPAFARKELLVYMQNIVSASDVFDPLWCHDEA